MENTDTTKQESFFDEIAEMQEKIIKGAEVLMNLDFEGSDQTGKTLVYQEDKMRLFHYQATVKKPCKVPALIVYALVNRHYMMDIDKEKSFIKKDQLSFHPLLTFYSVINYQLRNNQIGMYDI